MIAKEKINWQLVDKYYPYFVKKMQIIDAMMAFQNYEIVFEELYTAFIHINGEILKKESTKGVYGEFIKKAKILEQNISNLRLEEQKEHYSTIPLQKMTKLKKGIQGQSRELYMILMRVVSELNMFFPKVREDTQPGKEVLGGGY